MFLSTSTPRFILNQTNVFLFSPRETRTIWIICHKQLQRQVLIPSIVLNRIINHKQLLLLLISVTKYPIFHLPSKLFSNSKVVIFFITIMLDNLDSMFTVRHQLKLIHDSYWTNFVAQSRGRLLKRMIPTYWPHLSFGSHITLGHRVIKARVTFEVNPKSFKWKVHLFFEEHTHNIDTSSSVGSL